MIFDILANASQYRGIHEGIDRVLCEAAQYGADNYPEGKRELEGDSLFMIFAQYDTKNAEGAQAEAHRKYIDVMVMVEGEETIYVKNTGRLSNVTMPYNDAQDALLADTDADATPVRLTPGSFIVLFPQDAHTPACHTTTQTHVKKVIGKVRI